MTHSSHPTRETSRRLLAVPLGLALTLLAILGIAAPAFAVPADKPQVMSAWTQPTTASFNAWNSARLNQAAWAAYEFDWSTDYCTEAPDQPFGFDFRLPCQRHDWGYRNYRAIGQFSANKARLDDAFYFDLRRVCSAYGGAARLSCDSLAWTYYQAVRQFGGVVAVTQRDLDRAARLAAAA